MRFRSAALTADDFDQVTLTAPLNSRLPGGGGYRVTFPVRNARQATVGVSAPYFTRNQVLAMKRTTGTAST